MKVIRAGQLIDGTGAEPIHGANVVVGDDGTIQGVTQEGEIPQGAEIIDLSGYQVLPGLVDSHDHLCIDMADERAQAAEPLTWQAIKGIYNAGRMVRGGITTVRDVGEQEHVDKPLRQALNQHVFPGPRVLSCGEFITRRGGHGWYAGCQVDGPEDIRRAVREQLRNQADFIKAMVSGGVSTKGSDPKGQELSTEEIHVLVEESHRANRKVAVHLHGGPGARIAIEAGIDSLEHGMHLTPEEVQMLADRGTYLVVTYGITELAGEDPAVPDYYREKIAATLATYKEVIREACQRGVKVAIGGDGIHGRPALELRALVRGGFTPLQALRAATCNGADLLGLSHQIGTVEPGKRADLVAIEGDITADIMDLEKVRYVMRDGLEQVPNFSWPEYNLQYVF